jgi:HSP20 family protein
LLASALLRAEAPGFDPKDFDIHFSGNTLTIKAEHKEDYEEKREGYRTCERRYGRFQRSIPLSTEVNADKVEARFHSGVLEVQLPRMEPSQRRRIEVKS